jgi:signal transduction histidine kinase
MDSLEQTQRKKEQVLIKQMAEIQERLTQAEAEASEHANAVEDVENRLELARKEKQALVDSWQKKERDWLHQIREKDDIHASGQWEALERQLEEKENHIQELQAAFDKERVQRHRERERLASDSDDERKRRNEEMETLRLEIAALQQKLVEIPAPSASREKDAADPHQQVLGDLIFGMAHQIRNPLAIIRSTTESLMENPGAPIGRQPFEAILNGTRTLQERLDQLIDFTRPIEMSSQPVSASHIMSQVEKILKTRCRDQRVKWCGSVSSWLPTVPIHHDHLLTILLNLASNGLDAMEKGGTLSIGAERLSEEKMIELRITDTGHGITPGDLKEMGRPFFTTRAAKVGLGVAISKRIAQAYGCELVYESTQGKGTTVRIRLPIERTGV